MEDSFGQIRENMVHIRQSRPDSSEYGKFKTVKARLWPGRSGKQAPLKQNQVLRPEAEGGLLHHLLLHYSQA
jgi:hypothetical protein